MATKAPYCSVRIVPPYAFTHTFLVNAEGAGKNLLAHMAEKFSYREAAFWEEKINSGFVGVNGNSAEPGKILATGDRIFHHNPAVKEPSVPDNIEIIDEQTDFILVNKPAPLPMHPGGRYFKNTLSTILEERGFKNLHIVHRLDAVTSGIVLFARNKAFAHKAMTCFTEGNVEKVYYALVAGNPPEERIEIKVPIRRKTGFVFEVNPTHPGAKHATTQFEVIQRFADSAIIKCMPLTGRTHQIRLHLEEWGYPIIDDSIYGINGDKSSIQTQNAAISLINAGLKIPGLGIDYRLNIPRAWNGLKS